MGEGEGNHGQRFIRYHSLPLPFKDCTVIGEGEGNHGQRFIFFRSKTVKLLGRERETTDNVLFAIIPSPLPFKDCTVIGEGEGNH
jgi:hypothetical protein